MSPLRGGGFVVSADRFANGVLSIYGNYPFSVTTASGVITITLFWG